ncbi:MAG: CDP-alcohol phosphatidyltransferase family protein [Rubritalea sp.]|uniref:CDP-alcohol phosphatidyltransferase family protein n=1 Tax=Rubritalea sp. TaxID=2109375 RepID=UPI003241F4DC
MRPEWSEFSDAVHDGGGQWMTEVYHYAGAFFAFLASRCKVTPNQLTLASGLLVILAMVLMLELGLGSWIAAIGVLVLMVVSYALDCADGQLARATGQCSKYGTWLDHVVDAGKIFVVHGSIGWMLLNASIAHGFPASWCFLGMFLNMAGSALYFFAWNYKVMIAGQGLIVRLANERSQSRVRMFQFSQQITDYGWFPLLFILLIDPQKFALAYFLYGAGTFVIFMAYIVVSACYMTKLTD